MSAPGHSTALLAEISQILKDMAESSEDLGADLSANPQVLDNHMVQLQRIDLFAQTLSHLANILAAEHPDLAVGEVRLDQLRHQLAAANVAAAA